jgi:hypothetical protein
MGRSIAAGRGVQTSPNTPSDITQDELNKLIAQTKQQAITTDLDKERGATRAHLEALAKQSAPQVYAGIADPFWMDRQKQLAGTLETRAKGEGPSLAQMQFQQASNTALQKSLGAIRAATGANPALAGRTAALASTNLMGNLAAESGMARLKEQQDAQAALASLLNQGQTASFNTRGQDLSIQELNAKLAAQKYGQDLTTQGTLLGDTARRFEATRPGAKIKEPNVEQEMMKALIPAAVTVLSSGAGLTDNEKSVTMPTNTTTGRQEPLNTGNTSLLGTVARAPRSRSKGAFDPKSRS